VNDLERVCGRLGRKEKCACVLVGKPEEGDLKGYAYVEG